MKVKDIIDYLESIFPLESAAGFDNPGLLAGSKNSEVDKCVVTLDCTLDVVNYAIENKAQMIIAHHPLIFGGISNVCEDNANGRILSTLIRNGIALYAIHTNLDFNHENSNVLLAKALGAKDDSIEIIEEVECGVAYSLEDKTDLGSYKNIVNSKLGNYGVISINKDSNYVKKVFVQGGAFDEDSIDGIISNGVDTVVSGEIKHHITLLLNEYGINSVIAGHKATEDVFMPNLAKLLTERFENIPFLLSL